MHQPILDRPLQTKTRRIARMGKSRYVHPRTTNHTKTDLRSQTRAHPTTKKRLKTKTKTWPPSPLAP